MNGCKKCELTAIIHNGNESCFIKGDRAFCREKIDKKMHQFDNISSEGEYLKDRENYVINTMVTKPYGAAGLMPQYYCSTAGTANFTFIIQPCSLQ